MLESIINSIVSQGGYSNLLKNIPVENNESAAKDTLATIFEGLTKNSTTQDGIQKLASALDKNHNGNKLADINSLTQSNQGQKIIQHIFGNKLDNVTKALGSKNNISKNDANGLLATLAPIAMEALGAEKKQDDLDTNGLANMLQNTDTSFGSSILSQGLTKLLDQDGDGDLDLMDAFKFFTK